MIDPRLTTLRRSAGKPLLCIPFFVDQPDVAARVRDLGAGLTLDKQSISADNVRYSVLELVVLQLDCLDYFTGEFLDELTAVTAEHRAFIRSKLSSPELWRKNHTPWPRARNVERGEWESVDLAKEMDLTRYASWNQQELAVLDLIESVCFTDNVHGLLKTAQKGGKDLYDFLAFPSMQERLNAVKDAGRAAELRDDGAGVSEGDGAKLPADRKKLLSQEVEQLS